MPVLRSKTVLSFGELSVWTYFNMCTSEEKQEFHRTPWLKPWELSVLSFSTGMCRDIGKDKDKKGKDMDKGMLLPRMGKEMQPYQEPIL